MTAWRGLSEDERWHRFESLNLPEEVELFYREEGFEINCPIRLFRTVLDKLVNRGYVSFSIDVFHESGLVVIGAHLARDLAPNAEPASDFI